VDLTFTKVFADNDKAWLDPKIRRALNEGGTRSSKTYSILQLLIIIAQNSKSPLLISVVGRSIPHLRLGCIRDFFKILGENEKDNPSWNASRLIYNFGKCEIEFFSAENWEKVAGPTRDILYLYEVNRITWETALALDVRTTKFVFADWNPAGRFWIYDKWQNESDVRWIHSTYLDAKHVLPEAVVRNIESNKDKDPNWWRVFGLGLLGKIENLVYPHYREVDVLPDGDYFYGLDYGFSSDPTALVKNVIIGENLYSQEMFYDYNHLTNDDIAREMELLHVPHSAPIYADANEPKSAEELRRLGFNVRAVDKAFNRVKYRIKKVNEYYQHWTSDSINCIKEQDNYMFVKKTDPNTGLEYISDDTTHFWSHGMTAREFAVVSYGHGGVSFPSARSNRGFAVSSRSHR